MVVKILFSVQQIVLSKHYLQLVYEQRISHKRCFEASKRLLKFKRLHITIEHVAPERNTIYSRRYLERFLKNYCAESCDILQPEGLFTIHTFPPHSKQLDKLSFQLS